MIRAVACDNSHDASLAARLRARIARDGPINIETFMEACLIDAAFGAYTSRQPVGAQGDFITAPEISQIFGELLGLWSVAVWQSIGEPGAITMAELGPGRGTLTKDALRAWRGVPKFPERVSVALIETSPVMAEVQRKTLEESRVPLGWYAALDAVPEGPLIVLANEFVDALPIRQFVRRGVAWRERLVTTDNKGGFVLVEGPASQPELTDLGDAVAEGAILETRPALDGLLREFARRASRDPLAALIIDYGHAEFGFGDTLQAVCRHRFADPLTNPGNADLTAHVDFAELTRRAAALGLTTHGPLSQGEFLLKLGIGERRERLLKSATPAQGEAIASGVTRLIDPRQMGMLFKVLALTSFGLASPPPFGPANFILSS